MYCRIKSSCFYLMYPKFYVHGVLIVDGDGELSR